MGWHAFDRFCRSAFGAEQDLVSKQKITCHPYSRPRAVKWSFITARVGSTVVLTPHWWISFATGARKIARPTWSISQAVAVEFYRRVSGISELAGLQFDTRDVTQEPDQRKLKHTRFEWAERMQDEWIAGVLRDGEIYPLDRVGMFVWEKHAPGEGGRIALVDSNSDDDSNSITSINDNDSGPLDGKIGIYFHGGGYSHFSAHEDAQTSIIPRRLMETGGFASIYAVEYRLLPNPFPAALQDAACVYCDLVYRKRIAPERIVFIGDSAGGNVALALARWIRLERKISMPGGLLLLSPWCDPAHSFPETVSSYIPRPNPEDYLADEPAGRIQLIQSLLGHHPRAFVSDPYISPANQLGPQGRFTSFPPTFVHYGDAERLQKEIEMLLEGMRRDGVELEVEKTVDAVHDVLMFKVWNEKIRDDIYRRIKEWLDRLDNEGKVVQEIRTDLTTIKADKNTILV